MSCCKWCCSCQSGSSPAVRLRNTSFSSSITTDLTYHANGFVSIGKRAWWPVDLQIAARKQLLHATRCHPVPGSFVVQAPATQTILATNSCNQVLANDSYVSIAGLHKGSTKRRRLQNRTARRHPCTSTWRPSGLHCVQRITDYCRCTS